MGAAPADLVPQAPWGHGSVNKLPGLGSPSASLGVGHLS